LPPEASRAGEFVSIVAGHIHGDRIVATEA
jgi:hypothetical protein